MRPVTDLQRKVAPFEVVTEMIPAGDQPAAIAQIDRADHRRGEGHRAARRDRHRQDGHRRLGGRAAAAPRARHDAEQDARRPVRQRAARDDAAQRGGVLRLLLRLLPARGVHPADRHLHREGLLDQRRGGTPAALVHQQPADPPGHDRRRLRLLHLRPWHPAGVRRPDAQGQARRHHGARPAAAQAGRHAVHPQRHRRSPGEPSGSAATPSRSSRSTRSSPSGSRCSATRSSGCPRCTR